MGGVGWSKAWSRRRERWRRRWRRRGKMTRASFFPLRLSGGSSVGSGTVASTRSCGSGDRLPCIHRLKVPTKSGTTRDESSCSIARRSSVFVCGRGAVGRSRLRSKSRDLRSCFEKTHLRCLRSSCGGVDVTRRSSIAPWRRCPPSLDGITRGQERHSNQPVTQAHSHAQRRGLFGRFPKSSPPSGCVCVCVCVFVCVCVCVCV